MDMMMRALKMYFAATQCQVNNASNASGSERDDGGVDARDDGMEGMALDE